MSRAMDALTQAQHKAAEALYKSQRRRGGDGGAAGGPGAQVRGSRCAGRRRLRRVASPGRAAT